MDYPTYLQEMARNRAAYQSLRERIRSNHAGQYVALGDERVLATAPTFEGAKAALDQLDAVPEYYLIFPADMEPAFELSYDL